MRDRVTRAVQGALGRYGYRLVRGVASDEEASTPADPVERPFPEDFDQPTIDTILAVEGYTMTSPEKLFALCHAVRYVVQHDVPGAIVECGVWRGGSMMAVAKTLSALDAANRELYLFDTFEGMPEPTEHDVDLHGESALDRWNREKRNWLVPREARASIGDVRNSMESTGYDKSKVHYAKGLVEDTVPGQAPDQIALLRLDTDYYESTRHELIHLYPRLSSGGVLIIDDYGHFKGAEKAVNEFLDDSGAQILLNRIDYSARVAVKP